MYQALYRKYRPKNFEDVVGQDVIVKTLKNSIKNNIVSHAYLFNGPRGTGKTSIAKIFAKILNCHDLKNLKPCDKCISCNQLNNNQNIDIIEIDAASNNGVDEIREIRNKIMLVPSNSKYKIYIIDEVHMLTTQAFNALLKSLEEPPAHIIFIFATTEIHKIPKTILSRCQRFDYKRVSNDNIVKRLKYICEQEKIKIEDDALYEIAKLSDGGMRDSVSLLDQAVAYTDNTITSKDIHDINGTLVKDEINSFIYSLLNNDLSDVLSKIESFDNEGKNIDKIIREIIDILKETILYINAPKLVNSNIDFYESIKKLNVNKKIYSYITSFSKLASEIKNLNNSKLLFEIEIIKESNQTVLENNVIIDNNVETKEIKTKDNVVVNNVNIKENNEGAKPSEIVINKEKPIIDIDKIKEIKKIRISNSLSEFSQKEREKVKNKLLEIDDYISDKKYSKFVSLIHDGELKSSSNNYLMFMYKTDLLANSFNSMIKDIEEFLEIVLHESFRVIAIDLNDWNFIKDDYNKNKDKYVFIEEKIENIKENKNNEKKDKKNNIESMFDDIIEIEQ